MSVPMGYGATYAPALPPPGPMGYGPHVPQTTYEPTSAKAPPMSFHSIGVQVTPTTPTAAQAHSEMGVQTNVDFHHSVKKVSQDQGTDIVPQPPRMPGRTKGA